MWLSWWSRARAVIHPGSMQAEDKESFSNRDRKSTATGSQHGSEQVELRCTDWIGKSQKGQCPAGSCEHVWACQNVLDLDYIASPAGGRKGWLTLLAQSAPECALCSSFLLFSQAQVLPPKLTARKSPRLALVLLTMDSCYDFNVSFFVNDIFNIFIHF